MTTRQEILDFCVTLGDVYIDQPFHDDNWTVARHRHNRKIFAAVYDRYEQIWINVKCAPQLTFLWRDRYSAVIPAYHMNKEHWNSLILDGSIEEADIKMMIADSFELTV